MDFIPIIVPSFTLLFAAVVFGVRLEGKYNTLKAKTQGEHDTFEQKLINANDKFVSERILMNEKLSTADWKVNHLTLEGIKLKEDMAKTSNVITEISGLQREMSNNIVDIKKYLEQK